MRTRTFKQPTILSAWRKAGLYPFNPDIVLSKMKNFEGEKPDLILVSPSSQLPSFEANIREANAQRSQGVFDTAFKPFQQTPTTQTREAHYIYLTLRLQDSFSGITPLTPSYQHSFHAYSYGAERLILAGKLIEERERARVQDKKDKARRKSGSGKHVQKGGVIYKGHGAKQCMETNKEYDDWRANTKNTKLI